MENKGKIKKEELSPMMKHYLRVKESYKDCILFYRLGDFYEMFFEDAEKASELLDLTLTGRDCGLKERAPMCGIPFHAADVYISKLVSCGEKVAICEQLTEPNGRELVEREVVRIVTAGTVTNNELIDEKSNNFLCSVFLNEEGVGVSWVDITTGEFFVRSLSGVTAISETSDVLVKISPAEIICNLKAQEVFGDSPLVKHGVFPNFTYFSDGEFNFGNAEKTLKEQFGLNSLDSFGIATDNLAVSASGALLSYVKETQRQILKNITSLKSQNTEKFLMLDAVAIKNLELVKTLRDSKRYGSLLWLLDKTKTSMGARKLQNYILSPLSEKDEINYRLDAIEDFYKSTVVRQNVQETLSSVKDIGRISGKIANGNVSPRDCVALCESLKILPNLRLQLSGLASEKVNDILENLKDFSALVKLLSDAIITKETPVSVKDGGFIKEGFSKELDELKNMSHNGGRAISEMEIREREKTGIKTLKIGYNRVFGYYIELTNSVKQFAPYEYRRIQTLVGAERYVTEELKELEEKVLSSKERALSLEKALFEDIKEKLVNALPDLVLTADGIAELDVAVALAAVARENGYVRPEIKDFGNPLKIIAGRHPVVEAISKQRFVPNDCIMDSEENRTIILTGPNMAGKSTYMRQVALITIMAHIGSFVPAKSAEIPLTDKIFTRIGASDSLISDQSTFMVEMTEVANVLKNATENSLLILDEIGRGTSTFDGLSIAWAVVEEITEKIKAKTMFATHYHELTELEGVMSGIKNYKVAVSETPSGIIFVRKIMRGGTNKSFGIEVAALAGIDGGVVLRAREILKELEKNDITGRKEVKDYDLRAEKTLSEVEMILKDMDVENMSPMQALNVLYDLADKVKGK